MGGGLPDCINLQYQLIQAISKAIFLTERNYYDPFSQAIILTLKRHIKFNEEKIPTEEEAELASGKEKDGDKNFDAPNTSSSVEVVENVYERDEYTAVVYDFGFLY